MSATLMSAAVAIGLTACDNIDNIVNNEEPAAARAYTVSIPATIGGDQADARTRAVEFGTDGTSITTTFKTTDKVYVYNVTKACWASDGSSLVRLAPAAEAKNTTLNGTLQFAGGTPAVGDVIRLFYKLNNPNGTDATNSYFGYHKQTGNPNLASDYDFAEATMKIKSISGSDITLCQVSDATKTTAQFENLQSMFRQRLSFTEGGNPVTPTIKTLVVSSNYSVVSSYYPLSTTSTTQGNVRLNVSINNPVIDTNGDIYLALRFYGSATGDYLKFTAYADDGKYYECTKTAPTGGFQNGKYYYGAMTLDYQGAVKLPTFTGVTPVKYGSGDIYYKLEANNFTISGESCGVNFWLPSGYGGNITLSGLHAIDLNHDEAFLRAENQDYTLVLDGDNSVTTSKRAFCFQNSNHNIKLSGNGTLTLTVNSTMNCGIAALNYKYDVSNQSDITSELNVTTQLSADPTKTTVIRSARTDNGDGTYTWTYTVTTTP